MIQKIKDILLELEKYDIETRIKTINEIKLELKKYSPFSAEPVDCVLWVKNETVEANDYNPNSVAPPEMLLLETSIEQDGYTQPIVTWNTDNKYIVVDGFHRNRVGKECSQITSRVHGYLPVTVINEDRTNKGDRIASTVRHNRARGKHSVDSMSELVIDLKRRNRSNSWIAKNLGMDEDEILRLSQISGLLEMFENAEFSKSWSIDNLEQMEVIDE